MWVWVGLGAAVASMGAFLAGVTVWVGREERRLDDGDPRNPYHRWDGH